MEYVHNGTYSTYFIICYKLLPDFLSPLRFGPHRADVHRTSCALVFALIRLRNTREKDITQGKA